MRYRDRTHAGQVLAGKLDRYRSEPAVVLALPNGGIPVGLEIASALKIDFDLLMVSKITPKFNTEIGYGSVSESGEVNLNEDFIRRLNLSESEVAADIEKTKKKVTGRLKFYRLKKRVSIEGKTAILVDDGIASGYTMINSINTVLSRRAKEIVIAVPTAPLSSYSKISTRVSEIICPDVREEYPFAVADAYDHWYDLSNDRALKFLIDYGVAE